MSSYKKIDMFTRRLPSQKMNTLNWMFMSVVVSKIFTKRQKYITNNSIAIDVKVAMYSLMEM